MKRFILIAALLTACQSGDDETKSPSETQPAPVEAEASVKIGAVVLRLNEPVSEPLACIIPISVENGLEATTRVVMIAFDLMGSGDAAKGNMFAPAAEPGEITEARVIVEGQSCDAYDTISIPEIRCTSGDESCEDRLEFIDGKALRFTRKG